MTKAQNPLKWRGVDALIGRGLDHFKLPGKLGRSPVFFQSWQEITPFFIFTPHLKWGGVSVSGQMGLSFAGVDDWVNTRGKILTPPPFMIHTANFPGEMARYIFPEQVEEGAFDVWAAQIGACLCSYPTSAEDMAAQVRSGRIGGFGAAQQFQASPPGKPLRSWLAERGIEIPSNGSLPIRAVTVPSLALQ